MTPPPTKSVVCAVDSMFMITEHNHAAKMMIFIMSLFSTLQLKSVAETDQCHLLDFPFQLNKLPAVVTIYMTKQHKSVATGGIKKLTVIKILS